MNRTYRFHPGVYELGENEKVYSDMEAKGWRLVKRGTYLSRFQRVEPSRARYRVEIYTPPFLERSVLPEEQVAVFEDCGWEYVADQANMHIFRAPEGSGAPEFYDDPAQQAATLKKVRRDMWLGLVLSAAFLAFTAWFLSLDKGRFWAQNIRRALQCPTVYTFYLFWFLWCICQVVRGTWKISRTYRRLKKGLPLDHDPKGSGILRGFLNHGLLCLALLSLLLTGAQILGTKSYDLPTEPDGPYIMLEDMGYEGEPGKLYDRDPGVTYTRSFLADYWETLEVMDLPNNGAVWMRQNVYKLRFPGMADELAWVLMEDSVFVRDRDAFHELDVPGLDGAWATEGLELVAMKGDLVVYVEFLSSGTPNGMERVFDPVPICEALAECWS